MKKNAILLTRKCELKNLLNLSRVLKNFRITRLRFYWNGLLSLPYPNNCVICNLEHIFEHQQICAKCLEELPYTFFEKDLKNSIVSEVFFGRVKIENTFSLLLFEKRNQTQKLLHQLKYQNKKKLAVYLGSLLAKRIAVQLKTASIDFLVPITLHSKKEFSRGFNQSLMLAKGINEISAIPILEDTLYKKKHNSSQTKKSRQERIDNVSDIFGLKNTTFLENKHIAIVDDVLTTGATIEAVCLTFFKEVKNIKISVFTLAYAK